MSRSMFSLLILTSVLGGCRTVSGGDSAAKEAALPADVRVLWTCGASSDPDFVKLSIVETGGQLVARLYEESGDGERVASDVIEVEQVDLGNDAAVEYEQIANSYPPFPGAPVTSSKKTKQAKIYIQAFGDGGGVFQAKTGPTGSRDVVYDLACTRQSDPGSTDPGSDLVKLLDCEDGEAVVTLTPNAIEVVHAEENFSPPYTAVIDGTFQAQGENRYQYVEAGDPTSFVKVLTIKATGSSATAYALTIKSYTRKVGQPDSLRIVNDWQCVVTGENG